MSTEPKTASLSVVGQETVAQRVRALQKQARELAQDHVQALVTAMGEAERIAVEIAEGGDAYPAGVRDLARRFAEDAEARAQNITAISGRGS